GNPRLAAARTQLGAAGVVAGRDQTVCGYLVKAGGSPKQPLRREGAHPTETSKGIGGATPSGRKISAQGQASLILALPGGRNTSSSVVLRAASLIELVLDVPRRSRSRAVSAYPQGTQPLGPDHLVTGNDQQTIALTAQQRLHDLLAGGGVEAGEGLDEQQYRPFGEQQAGQGNAPGLAAGDGAALLAQRGVQAALPGPVRQRHILQHPPQLGVTGSGVAEAQVVGQ